MIEPRLRRVMSSQYMQWAKTHLQARFNLASSGLVRLMAAPQLIATAGRGLILLILAVDVCA